MEPLGTILANAGNQIEAVIDGADLDKPVGTAAHTLKSTTLQATKPDLSVFDVPLTLSASVTASADIAAGTDTFQPFGDEPLAAPAGSSYARLKVDGTLGLKGAVPPTGAALQLSGSAAASGSFSYLHLLPVAQTSTCLQAYVELARTTQLPQLVDFPNLISGEVDQLTAAFAIDLGVKATAGGTFNTSSIVNLFDGLSGAVKASVQYSLEAALGWTLNEQMSLTVARAQQRNPDWIRVRLERAHKSALTFNVTFGLQAQYDATDVVTVLQRALAMSPVMGVVKTLNEVLATLATGDWEKVKSTISDYAANRLTAIAGPAWTNWLDNSQEVADFVALANKIVNFYNGLDAKVQSLWTDVLTRLKLGEGSEFADTVAKIAALDPNTALQNLLSPELLPALQMIESLTGKSIEELILGSSSAAADALAKAKKLAGQIQTLLTNPPQEVDDAIQKISGQFGIDKAVAFLSANATSTEKLNDAANRWLRDLVSKLVGKAFGAIGADDLQKVQTLAQKLQTQVLNAEAAINAGIQQAIAFSKGNAGFSAAFEISRVTESTALLDFEFNPANAAIVASVSASLPSGDVQKLLTSLDNAASITPLPFDIRESLITTKRMRTGAIETILTLFKLQNLQSYRSVRFDTSRLVVTNTGREAEYTGGYTLSIKGDGDTECSTWIESHAAGAGFNPDAAYDTVAHSLRLSFGRTDQSMSDRELAAYDRLLDELGFPITDADKPSVVVPQNAESNIAVSLSLGPDAIQTFIQEMNDHGTGIDIRNAASRVLVDGIVTFKLFAPPRERGDVNSRIIISKTFSDTWTDSSGNALIQAGTGTQIADENVVVGGAVQPPYTPVLLVIRKRPDTLKSVNTLATAFPAAGLTPSGLMLLARKSSDAFGSTTTTGEFDNPSFNLWFVLARLSRLNANVLKGARGLAVLRWKVSGAADFTTKNWQLGPNGIPTDLMAGRAFPLPADAP